VWDYKDSHWSQVLSIVFVYRGGGLIAVQLFAYTALDTLRFHRSPGPPIESGDVTIGLLILLSSVGISASSVFCSVKKTIACHAHISEKYFRLRRCGWERICHTAATMTDDRRNKRLSLSRREPALEVIHRSWSHLTTKNTQLFVFFYRFRFVLQSNATRQHPGPDRLRKWQGEGCPRRNCPGRTPLRNLWGRQVVEAFKAWTVGRYNSHCADAKVLVLSSWQ